MEHYQGAGFSEEVSRLSATPRWPSTNRICRGQRFDPLSPTAAQIAAFLYSLFDTVFYTVDLHSRSL